MAGRRVRGALLGALVVFVLASPASAGSLTTAEQHLLEEINRVRGAHGLRPLRLDWRLQTAARRHSRNMLSRGYVAHGSFAWRLSRAGAAGPTFGENVAWGVGRWVSARVVVRRWMASATHRGNLLRPGFRRVGVGTARGRFHGYRGARVVTADFAGS